MLGLLVLGSRHGATDSWPVAGAGRRGGCCRLAGLREWVRLPTRRAATVPGVPSAVDPADADRVAEGVTDREVGAVGLFDRLLRHVGARRDHPVENRLDIVGGESQPPPPG